MPRLLLLLPTETYRAKDFLAAARRLGVAVDLVVASEHPNTLERHQPDGLITLDFRNPEVAARQAARFAEGRPLTAVVPVDDETAVVAAAIAEALSLPHNSLESARAARNKHRMRELLKRQGVPAPAFNLFSLDDDPAERARSVSYPCVLKPLFLSASRGVIRADDEPRFVAAFRRIEAILGTEEVRAREQKLARKILVEAFIPGQEVALEGLLTEGNLQVLALFDKPDPLDGPFFEETIYVTPSRLSETVQDEIALCAARAAKALGLTHGPVHVELRVNRDGPWIIEIGARSIGGLCSRTLRFSAGMSLEELIIRHAVGMELGSLERERLPAGVMMIPIPHGGVLNRVRRLEEARAVAGIEEITMAAHPGMELVPLPEGSRYLGFIFSRAETPARVEAALREAHRALEFVIDEV